MSISYYGTIVRSQRYRQQGCVGTVQPNRPVCTVGTNGTGATVPLFANAVQTNTIEKEE
jgi:hypothetical protein